MASISGSREERLFTIDKWLGLNENPDGDTKLKNGEATICTNWKITRDNNLRRRGGTYQPMYNGNALLQLGEGVVQGLWTGDINGKTELLGFCDGKAFRMWDDDNHCYIKEQIGIIGTPDRVFIFPFGGKAYILTGHEYYSFDGNAFEMVRGYRPLIYTSLTPTGAQPTGGSSLEQVNKLTGARRVWYSPDGSATSYTLPEQNLVSVDYVQNAATGAYIPPTDYTADTINGTVTFTTAPTAGTNTIEIGYTAVGTFRNDVTSMRFAEMYSGSTDVNVFLYGNGTNKAIYSGLDYNGTPRADYFPDLNEMAVGEANTPITGLIRHLSALIAFKTDSTWSVTYGTVTLATGDTTEGFYVIPTNRTIGNVANGMVQNILNAPYTLSGKDLYEWKSSRYYSAGLNKDERTAKRVSDRIFSTLATFDIPNCYTFDDNYNQEYYIVNTATSEALVWNYVANAWYHYDNFPMCSAIEWQGEVLFGTNNGKIEILTDDEYSDNDVAFSSVWESGSMDFGKPYERKYSSEMWVVIKPQSRGHVGVTIRTDKKSDFEVKDTDSSLWDFWDIDFSDISFDINRSPRTYRHRLKAKKFCFYKLRFESNDSQTGATVLTSSFRVRYIGFAK